VPPTILPAPRDVAPRDETFVVGNDRSMRLILPHRAYPLDLAQAAVALELAMGRREEIRAAARFHSTTGTPVLSRPPHLQLGGRRFWGQEANLDAHPPLDPGENRFKCPC
jgi:hypothetical protein